MLKTLKRLASALLVAALISASVFVMPAEAAGLAAPKNFHFIRWLNNSCTSCRMGPCSGSQSVWSRNRLPERHQQEISPVHKVIHDHYQFGRHQGIQSQSVCDQDEQLGKHAGIQQFLQHRLHCSFTDQSHIVVTGQGKSQSKGALECRKLVQRI